MSLSKQLKCDNCVKTFSSRQNKFCHPTKWRNLSWRPNSVKNARKHLKIHWRDIQRYALVQSLKTNLRSFTKSFCRNLTLKLQLPTHNRKKYSCTHCGRLSSRWDHFDECQNKCENQNWELKNQRNSVLNGSLMIPYYAQALNHLPIVSQGDKSTPWHS